MSSIKIVFVSSVLLLLSACSVFEPFVDRRRNAGESDLTKLYVGRSTLDEPAICANGLWTTEAQIQALADAECVKHQTGTHAVFSHKSLFTCKLLLPTHSYFKCEK